MPLMQMMLCMCGCGGELEQYDSRNRPRKYINGHNVLGRKLSDDTKDKIRKARFRDKNYNWKESVRQINNSGYVVVKDYDHPTSYSNGRILEHRLIWEKYHNASLLHFGAVHHKNGIKTDNRPENLEAMINNLHVKLHKRGMI